MTDFDTMQEKQKEEQNKARHFAGLKPLKETKVRHCNNCASKFPSYREERICNVCKKSETFRSNSLQGYLIDEEN